jgi:hypothetical protein
VLETRDSSTSSAYSGYICAVRALSHITSSFSLSLPLSSLCRL